MNAATLLHLTESQVSELAISGGNLAMVAPAFMPP